MAEYEILEHTADVGVRARGVTLEETFEASTRGLIGVLGAQIEGEPAERVAVAVEAPDLAALLVDWLSEVLYLQDSRDALIGKIDVQKVDEGRASGVVEVAPRGERALEGTAVKAITYHQIKVERSGDGWVAEFYVDV